VPKIGHAPCGEKRERAAKAQIAEAKGKCFDQKQ
jgi:hypothetical protein